MKVVWKADRKACVWVVLMAVHSADSLVAQKVVWKAGCSVCDLVGSLAAQKVVGWAEDSACQWAGGRAEMWGCH